ncbi:MAG TPA: IS1595 family transposase [Gemmataceae bacterium]|jgi:transposase-like protein
MDANNPSLVTPKTLVEAIRFFADPDNCLNFLKPLRWPNGITCPRCGSADHSFISTRRVWKCKGCKKQFSIKVGTIMKDSPLGLDKWLTAIWLIANAKNGVSSWEIHRALGITQKSAWFLLHRIRLAMQTGSFAMMEGEVEADETFIGGKARNMHKDKRAEKITSRGAAGKAIVVGVLDRETRKVVTAHVADTKRATLQGHVRNHVELGSAVYTHADLSPDGSLLLVRDQKRIDLWSFKSSSHVCGLAPEPNATSGVSYAKFVDEKRLLTVVENRLVLWEVPACRAMWSLGGVTGSPAMSPGHKYVAVGTGAGIDLLDVNSGERLGSFAGLGVSEIRSADFRPDGKQFAATVKTIDGKKLLARWDAATGALVGSAPAPEFDREISWAGDGYILAGHSLIDLQLGWIVEEYHAGARFRDGRLWSVSWPKGVLFSKTIPNPALKDLAKNLANKSLQPVLVPGMTINLQIRATDLETQRKAIKDVTETLERRGFRVGSDGPVTMTIQLESRLTGKSVGYHSIRRGKDAVDVTVPLQEIDCVATLRDARGLLLEHRAKCIMLPPNEVDLLLDVAAYLKAALWHEAYKFAGGLNIPTVVLRSRSGVVTLPGR